MPSNLLLRCGDNTGHAVVGPVAAQGQITATHEPLRDRQAVVPLPQYPEFIEEFGLAHGVGGGGGEGGFVDDTIYKCQAFLADEAVCVQDKGYKVGTSGESVGVVLGVLLLLALEHGMPRRAKGISAIRGSVGVRPRDIYQYRGEGQVELTIWNEMRVVLWLLPAENTM